MIIMIVMVLVKHNVSLLIHLSCKHELPIYISMNEEPQLLLQRADHQVLQFGSFPPTFSVKSNYFFFLI